MDIPSKGITIGPLLEKLPHNSYGPLNSHSRQSFTGRLRDDAVNDCVRISKGLFRNLHATVYV